MIVSILIIVIAAAFQLKAFNDTRLNRKKLKNIFPESPETELSTDLDEDSLSVQVVVLNEEEKSDVFQEIIGAINNYIKKNQGTADYSTLREITDRQSDAIESKIDALSPVPVYIGLSGTVSCWRY